MDRRAGAILAGVFFAALCCRRRLAGGRILELLRADPRCCTSRSVRCACWWRLAGRGARGRIPVHARCGGVNARERRARRRCVAGAARAGSADRRGHGAGRTGRPGVADRARAGAHQERRRARSRRHALRARRAAAVPAHGAPLLRGRRQPRFLRRRGQRSSVIGAAAWRSRRSRGCAGFGAISGSSLATAATMGQVGLPEMRRRGYSTALATGAVAAGGTLGSLMPPSGALIVFGIIAEQSIGKLFTAAIIPVHDAGAVLHGRDRHALPRSGRASRRPRERVPWRERGRPCCACWISRRWWRSCSCGIARRLVHAHRGGLDRRDSGARLCALRKRLTLRVRSAKRSREHAASTSGMIYVVIIGALIFAAFMSFTGLAEQIARAGARARTAARSPRSWPSPCCCCCWDRCSTGWR